MSRTVTLVLVAGAGIPLGALPPFDVDFPFWPEVQEIVVTARERFGIDVTVLRILATEPGLQHSGRVTYLAEVAERPDLPPLAPIEANLPPALLTEESLRADYAKPGGPGRSLAWARSELTRAGRGPVLEVKQRKTWNLSAIWLLETSTGPIWLKQVPHFFAHEAAVLRYLADSAKAPRLLAAEQCRMLLEHIPGNDLYGTDIGTRIAIAGDMFDLQLDAAGRISELLAAGVPDYRGHRLGQWLRTLADEPWIDQRLAMAAECGLPDTLVHGDLHPGNVRGGRDAGNRRTIIDWGDSFVGHPAFDILRLTERLEPFEATVLIDYWVARWRAAVPGCDPAAAVAALRPVAALRNATVYAHFLANIEPSEHPYHAADVPRWLAEAHRIAAAG